MQITVTQNGACFTARANGTTYGTDAAGHGLWRNGVQLLDPAQYGATTAAHMRWLVRYAIEHQAAASGPAGTGE